MMRGGLQAAPHVRPRPPAGPVVAWQVRSPLLPVTVRAPIRPGGAVKPAEHRRLRCCR
jgi:hypothetical protein